MHPLQGVLARRFVAMLGWCGRRDLNPGVFSPFREAIRSVAGFRRRILLAVPVLDQVVQALMVGLLDYGRNRLDQVYELNKSFMHRS